MARSRKMGRNFVTSSVGPYLEPQVVLVDRIGFFWIGYLGSKGLDLCARARPGMQGLETMEEMGEQLRGKGISMEEREGQT